MWFLELCGTASAVPFTAIVLLSEYMLLRIGIIAFSKAHLLAVLVSRAIHKSLNVGIRHTAVGKLLDKTVFGSHSINKRLSF